MGAGASFAAQCREHNVSSVRWHLGVRLLQTACCSGLSPGFAEPCVSPQTGLHVRQRAGCSITRVRFKATDG